MYVYVPIYRAVIGFSFQKLYDDVSVLLDI